MRANRAGKNGEARKRVVPASGLSTVLPAVLGWLRGLRPSRLLLAFGTVFGLSALLLIPSPEHHAATVAVLAPHGALAGISIGKSVVATAHAAGVEPGIAQNLRFSYSLVIGVIPLVALMVGFVGLYLVRFDPKLYVSTSKLALLSMLVGLGVLCVKAGAMMLGSLTPMQFGYISLMGITACAMCITELLEPYVALVIAALLSLVSVLILRNAPVYCLMTFVTSLVAVLGVTGIKGRGDVARAGLAIAGSNIVLTFLLGQVVGDSWPSIGVGVLWSAAAAVVSIALFSIGVVLFERPFGLTTHIGLLELSDPNRKLLKQFSLEAPGTYHHSVMVGNLAAAAAEKIGADALLCRVAAYYHDLGKMRRAEFFVENQNGDNIHERLQPSLSALVVTAHVREGLQIAEEAKLPPAIKDIIVQHHGTSLIRYFYHRATRNGCGERGSALENQFRYPGPKPQTREAAIMMLADAVEAASHVLEKPTPARLEEFVQKMIDDKVDDGQLEESPLTLRDLKAIRDSFVHQLSGMLHSRIDYPTDDGKIEKPVPQTEINASQTERNATQDEAAHSPTASGDRNIEFFFVPAKGAESEGASADPSGDFTRN